MRVALDAALAAATLLLLVAAQNPGERAKAETDSGSVSAFLGAAPDFFRREARGGTETSLYDAILPPTNGMNLLHTNSNWQLIFGGFILLAAVLVDHFLKGRRS